MHYYKNFLIYPVTSCPLDGKPLIADVAMMTPSKPLRMKTAALVIADIENKDETTSKHTVLISFVKDQNREQLQRIALLEVKLTDVINRLHYAEQVIAPRQSKNS